ncbi:MAG: hypothetical protein LBU09_00835, partial [Endomicrobium sp.]|nr:hypothetical protein [Endomicrobium sp.]
MPFTMRWGVGLRSLVFSHYSKKKDTYSYDEIKIAVEMGSVSGQDKIFTAGIQYAFLNTLLLRLGYNKRITYGLGLRFSDVLQLDYAYLPQNGDIEHRLAAVYRWGNKYKDEFTPSDKALTDDFQKTYKMASRL